MSERRADLDPMTRAVSDTLDELLWRHFEIASSWSNPEDFIKWLDERGYEIHSKSVLWCLECKSEADDVCSEEHKLTIRTPPTQPVERGDGDGGRDRG